MAEEERSLFPVADVGDFTEEEESYIADFKPSLAWDCEKGDFVRSMDNKILMTDGVEAFKVWCIKAVATERFTCLAYDDDIGAEMEDAFQEFDSDAVELAVERTIVETLKANPRTESVENFLFTWKPDAVEVSFDVVCTRGWESFRVETMIKR